MNITELGGHSGCRILLCETDAVVFVRKIAGNIEYNARLMQQEKKQEYWGNDVIHAPEVYNIGYTDDGLFFFDMEYIHGITLAEYMKTVEVSGIRNLVDSLSTNVISMFYTEGPSDEEVFCTKINELAKKLSNQDKYILNQGIKLLREHSWKYFARTPCHGDLTLENIIVKDDRIYLIDFLDSFYDSWLLDIGCLLQDVQTLWAYREMERIDNNTIIRLTIFRDILVDRIKKMAGEKYVSEIYYALLLKLFRIYPYAMSGKDRTFLEEKINLVINIIHEVNG